MNLKTKFYNFLKTLFPSSWTELFLFLFFLIFYGSIAWLVSTNYRIVFDDRIPWDAYFSFDNRAIVMTGGGFERHPLANYFFTWIRETALFFSGGKKDVNFRLALSLISALTVSLSVLQIFKYLRNIIGLPLFLNLLLVVFFSLFSTSILLSFTPETYTYTLFFLVLFNYYAALKLKKNEKISMSALTFAGISVGGLTITNIVKIYLPVLFEKDLFKSWKKVGNAVLRILFSFVVFLLLFLYRMNFDWKYIFNKTSEQYEKFSKPKVTPIWDMITSWFFGGNMLFPSFVIRDYHNKKFFDYKAIFMDVYQSYFSYLFVGTVLFLMIWSCAKNYKNKLVQVLILSFSVDIFIHCVFKFGLHTSYIYGGHFIFVVPLFLGWLLFSYRKSPKVLSLLTVFISLLFIYLGINNFYRLMEFYEFLEVYYQ